MVSAETRLQETPSGLNRSGAAAHAGRRPRWGAAAGPPRGPGSRSGAASSSWGPPRGTYQSQTARPSPDRAMFHGARSGCAGATRTCTASAADATEAIAPRTAREATPGRAHGRPPPPTRWSRTGARSSRAPAELSRSARPHESGIRGAGVSESSPGPGPRDRATSRGSAEREPAVVSQGSGRQHDQAPGLSGDHSFFVNAGIINLHEGDALAVR